MQAIDVIWDRASGCLVVWGRIESFEVETQIADLILEPRGAEARWVGFVDGVRRWAVIDAKGLVRFALLLQPRGAAAGEMVAERFEFDADLLAGTKPAPNDALIIDFFSQKLPGGRQRQVYHVDADKNRGSVNESIETVANYMSHAFNDLKEWAVSSETNLTPSDVAIQIQIGRGGRFGPAVERSLEPKGPVFTLIRKLETIEVRFEGEPTKLTMDASIDVWRYELKCRRRDAYHDIGVVDGAYWDYLSAHDDWRHTEADEPVTPSHGTEKTTRIEHLAIDDTFVVSARYGGVAVQGENGDGRPVESDAVAMTLVEPDRMEIVPILPAADDAKIGRLHEALVRTGRLPAEEDWIAQRWHWLDRAPFLDETELFDGELGEFGPAPIDAAARWCGEIRRQIELPNWYRELELRHFFEQPDICLVLSRRPRVAGSVPIWPATPLEREETLLQTLLKLLEEPSRDCEAILALHRELGGKTDGPAQAEPRLFEAVTRGMNDVIQECVELQARAPAWDQEVW